jgi:hypothetical protein
MRGGKYNRVLYWPAVLAVFWLWWLIRQDDLISDLVGFAGWTLSATVGIGTCTIALAEREWRRAISALILPLSLIVVTLNYHALMRFGDYLHIRLHNCDYSDPPCF